MWEIQVSGCQLDDWKVVMARPTALHVSPPLTSTLSVTYSLSS